MATPETFRLDIQRWIEKAKGRTKQFATEFIQDLNEEVVRATPVNTGFLRGSWYATIGGGEASGEGSIDKDGSTSVSRMNLVAAELNLGDTYTATNGAAYAGFVEYGTSRMAPRAFVRGTMDRAPEIAEATAKRVAGS